MYTNKVLLIRQLNAVEGGMWLYNNKLYTSKEGAKFAKFISNNIYEEFSHIESSIKTRYLRTYDEILKKTMSTD